MTASAGRAADDLAGWIEGQARRERAAVRLEDALLGDRYPAYFWYRLRFFVLTTVIAVAVHAIRVVLLFEAFSAAEFLAVVVAGAAAAVLGDAWWGALERMRGRIRRLQASRRGHLAPREIASWLRLSAWLTGLGLGVAGMLLVGAVAAGPGLTPAGLMIVGIVGGAAVQLTVRTYHSGAFAIRRIYRPMPSLVIMDVAGLAVLLAAWPLAGQWAFPIAEVASLAVAAGISLRYTGRTYRVLGFPGLRALLRLPVPPPGRRLLREAIAPAAAYGLVGLDAIVLLVVLEAAAPGAGPGVQAPMVALLAALAPVIRAGFEWARLLYFDLVRLGVRLLVALRARFDRAALGLAVVVGLVAWAVAALTAVLVLGVRDWALVLVLVPFFEARSLLAAAQMRSFAAAAYRRLTLVGLADLAAFGVALVLVPTTTGRVLVLAGILGLSAAVLVALPAPPDEGDLVAARLDWLRTLRLARGPVVVTRLRFDGRTLVRGAPREARATEAWRRRGVAHRVARAARAMGGGATWLSALELAWWAPVGAPVDPGWVARVSGGLVVAPPRVTSHADGAAAARAVAADDLRVDLEAPDPPPDALLAAFASEVPGGLAHVAGGRASPELARLDSQERAAAFRAGLRFARELRAGRRTDGRFEVTALVDDGAIVALLLIPVGRPVALRRRWRGLVTERCVRSAARG